jgi:hypothetical protein
MKNQKVATANVGGEPVSNIPHMAVQNDLQEVARNNCEA